MGNLSEQPKIFEPKIEKSEIQTYTEENLADFENVEIKKLSELSCWGKISDFITSKKMAGIENVQIIVAGGGKQWERIFGSNDSKSSHRPIVIILKKEIFDNENISDEDASWLVHEIGHIKFYQDLGDKLGDYMEEYHRRGEYTDSDMEKAAFELQFEYLKSIGKTKDECEDVIKKYLNKSFGEDKKESKENEYKQIMMFLDNIYEADTNISQAVENGDQEEKRRKILIEKRAEIDQIRDAKGEGIDEEIKDVVVAFSLAGFPTLQSCQGHYGEEKGYGAPYIEIGNLDEPEWRFQNEEAIYQRIAAKYGLTVEGIKRMENHDAWSEAQNEASNNEETAEYKAWDHNNQIMLAKIKHLLKEFYNDPQRKVDENCRLQIRKLPGRINIHNGGNDYKDVEGSVSEEEKEEHKKRLESYRKEMNAFSDFLLDKFIQLRK